MDLCFFSRGQTVDDVGAACYVVARARINASLCAEDWYTNALEIVLGCRCVCIVSYFATTTKAATEVSKMHEREERH